MLESTSLQLSAGIDQIFELRFSQGGYRIGWMIFDYISNEKTVAMVISLFESSMDCLSFAASQMVRLYPIVAPMLVHGPAVLKALFENTPTSIDFSERSHNQFRPDLMSHGLASSFAAASERLLCRQFAAEHISRSGRDVALTPVAFCDDDATANGSSCLQSRTGCGGSAFQLLHNLRMGTFKNTHAPDRALTAEEREEIEGKIHKEWARVGSMSATTNRGSLPHRVL